MWYAGPRGSQICRRRKCNRDAERASERTLLVCCWPQRRAVRIPHRHRGAFGMNWANAEVAAAGGGTGGAAGGEARRECCSHPLFLALGFCSASSLRRLSRAFVRTFEPSRMACKAARCSRACARDATLASAAAPLGPSPPKSYLFRLWCACRKLALRPARVSAFDRRGPTRPRGWVRAGPCNIRREGGAFPCSVRREGGHSLVMLEGREGHSLVMLEGREGIPL